MGKVRVVWTLGFLTALACWLYLPSIAAQAAIFTVNSPSDVDGAAPLNAQPDEGPNHTHHEKCTDTNQWS